MSTGMEHPFRACCEIIGTGGRIYITHLFAGREVHVTIGNEEHVERFEGVDPHQAEIEHFSDCVLHDRAPRIPPEDSLENTEVLVALAEAARTGRAVAL